MDGANYLLLYYKSTKQATSATQGPTGVFPISKGSKISVISRTVKKVELECEFYPTWGFSWPPPVATC